MMRDVGEIVGSGLNQTDGLDVSEIISLWHKEYLTKCFANERVCMSFGLWVISAFLWIIAHTMLICLQCQKKPVHFGSSAFITIYSFLGNMCNALGALLAKQLTVQVFTGAYLTAVDILYFILIFFPVCKWEATTSGGSRKKLKKGRRKRNVFAVTLPLVVGSGYCISKTTFQSKPFEHEFHGTGRRLLTTFLQDNTEILGYALGLVAFIICWTSKFSHISRAYKVRMFSAVLIWSQVFSILASVLYAAAILFHDKQLKYILKALPWLLNSLGCAALDTAILLLLCCTKSSASQQTDLERSRGADTQALLAQSVLRVGEEEEEEEEEELHVKSNKKAKARHWDSDWIPLNTLPNNHYLNRMAEIGRFIDLSIEPVQEVPFGAVRLPGEGEVSPTEISKDPEPPAYPPLKVIRAALSSSSGSVSGSPSMTSELEQNYLEALNREQWDFEDVTEDWSKDKRQQNLGVSQEVFPLQDWASLPLDNSIIQTESDFWFCHGNVEMTEERAAVILADYERENQRSGK
ncbi:transmembrane protein 44-like isoform X2 [Polyodon spathula]|uniref:transmembrane protein 44-like isoform X2 n=1 Tax=Polyodon spathula TaxID=7913 RepID=UPI001B7F07A6|nr:transmembrane protein 44-like isoform X2 [Polyodon spathula]